MKNIEVTWKDTVESIGFSVVELEGSTEGDRLVQLKPKHGGAYGYGSGKTMEDAIKSSTGGLPFDFYQARRRLASNREAEIENRLIAECDAICRF